jgi:hypothetical protein
MRAPLGKSEIYAALITALRREHMRAIEGHAAGIAAAAAAVAHDLELLDRYFDADSFLRAVGLSEDDVAA